MLKVKIYRTAKVVGYVSPNPPEVFVGAYTLKNFSVSSQIKSSPSFSFEVDFSNFTSFPFLKDTTYSFYLYRFEQLLYTGIVGDLDVDYTKRLVKFTCEDRTFMLSFIPAEPLVRWETRNVLAIIQYLLENRGDDVWPFSGFSGTLSIKDMESPTQTVLVDTTNDENLLTQINNILNSIPNAYLFADNILGPESDYTPPPLGTIPRWVFHVRSYSSTPVFGLDPSKITTFNTNWQQQPALLRVYPYGAEYDAAGTPAIVTLVDKTIADISGFTSSIIDNWVENDAYGSPKDPSETRFALKIFDEIKPKTLSSPAVNQRRRASNALYKRAVRFLQDYSTARRYNISIEQDLTGIEIGNRVTVNQQTIISKMQQSTAQIDYVNAGNLDLSGEYFVESFRANYSEDDVRFDLVVLDSNNFLTRDQEVVAYTSKKDQKLKTYNVEPTVKRHGFFDLTLGTGLGINCGGNGRSFTFTKASGDFGDIATVPAANAAADYYWYYAENLVNNNAVTVVVTTQPTILGLTFTFCVSVNGTWTTSDSVRLKVLVAWT